MNHDEKSTVNIDADGAVVKCAKSLPSTDCGYKVGAEMCGKCGAMAVEVKMVPVDIFETKGSKDKQKYADGQMVDEMEEE